MIQNIINKQLVVNHYNQKHNKQALITETTSSLNKINILLLGHEINVKIEK